VDPALADALHDLTVVAGRHAELAGLRVAHVDVHDGRSGACGLDRGGGDLLGRDRAVRALRDLGVVAGDGAGDNDVGVHGSSPRRTPGLVILWPQSYKLAALHVKPGWAGAA